MNNLPPMIKIEIDEMKYAIMHHLNQHHQEVEDEVLRQVESAIKEYDFEAVVAQNVRACISNGIKTYFEYGPGKVAIEQAVWASLDLSLNKTGE